MSLACTLFHFFSFHFKLFPAVHLLLPCTSLTQSVPIFIFLLRHSSYGLTQALVHTILFQRNPVSHIIFPPAVRTGQAQVQCFPRTHLPLSSELTSSLILVAGSCSGQPVFGSPDPGAEMSSVYPQSQQPFLTLVDLFLPLGFNGQRGDALNRAVPAYRPELGVEFGFFLLPSNDPRSLFYLLQKSLAFLGRLRSVSHTHSSNLGAVKPHTQLPLTVPGCHQQQWEGHCAQLLWQQPERITYPANLQSKLPALYCLHYLGQVQLLHNPY